MQRLCAALLALAATAAAAAPTTATYSIAPLRTDLDSDAKLGSRRAGLLCGPAGAVRWRDVKPDASDFEKAAAEALHARGIDAFVPSEQWLDESGPPTPYRLVPTVDALTIRVCLPHAGPLAWAGAAKRVKASGEITVTWRNYDRTSRQLVWTRQVALPFSFDRDASGASVAVTAAIAATADRLAGMIPETPGVP